MDKSEEGDIRPNYYKRGHIEVLDIIRLFKLNFWLGNVIKYVLRASNKGTPLEDLKKAMTYLRLEIEHLEQVVPAPEPRLRVRLFFAWYDFWVGAFYDQKKRVLYICLLPMVVLELRYA